MTGAAGDLRRRRAFFLRRRKKRPPSSAMTVMEHLGELRSRLIVSLVAFLLLSVGAFVLYQPIFDFLIRPLCGLPESLTGGCRLAQLAVLEGFQVRLKLTAIVGIAASSPIWLYQVWAFVTPALSRREKRYAAPFILSSIVLFAAGATFGYLLLPKGLEILLELGGEGLEPFLRADSYVNFIGLMLIAFGITFELPLLLFFLGLVGVVTPTSLRSHRRAAVVAIAALAAVVTPSQDPYTLFAMAIPLYLMYELTILLLVVVTRRRAQR